MNTRSRSSRRPHTYTPSHPGAGPRRHSRAVRGPRSRRKPTRAKRRVFPLFVLFLVAASATTFFVARSRTHPRASTGGTPALLGIPNPRAPLQTQRLREEGVPFTLITGGVAGTRRSPLRQGVADFVRRSRAAAGLNGTFFANASLRGTDNLLIGPSLCGDEAQATLSPFDRQPALAGRPLVLLSPSRTRLVPYDPARMDADGALRELLPGVTDAFLGGVWLVRDGRAAGPAEVAAFHMADANDPRRRAFFAVLPDGRPALGATTGGATSLQLARALQDAGVREAVLLDSGFSTSLVRGRHILVTGHTAPGLPSRPVPHALVLFAPTEESQSLPNASDREKT